MSNDTIGKIAALGFIAVLVMLFAFAWNQMNLNLQDFAIKFEYK